MMMLRSLALPTVRRLGWYASSSSSTALGLIVVGVGAGGTATAVAGLASPKQSPTSSCTAIAETTPAIRPNGAIMNGNVASIGGNLESRLLGLQRELKFWGRVAPVVADYWWHTSSRSPFVKYQEYYHQNQSSRATTDTILNSTSSNSKDQTQSYNGGSKNNNDKDRKELKRKLYQSLHERNAPKIYGVMVDLGGLYVKLGQVLSVTALPVPSQYRELFRTLQSNVPGHEEFESVIKPTIEAEFGRPLHEVFESIEEIPVGSASIGQAHRAKIRKHHLTESSSSSSSSFDQKDENDGDGDEDTIDVIVKVQYPDARWQVPADIDCVGDFLKLCVYFGVVDESSASMSFEEFSRQFLSELQYKNEAKNLQESYDSSIDPRAPYKRRGVIIPKPFPKFCTDRVITMTYLPGPKFEESARKQLESLGIDTKRGMHVVFEDSEANELSIPSHDDNVNSSSPSSPSSSQTNSSKLSSESTSLSKSFQQSLLSSSWTMSLAEGVGNLVGMDNIFFLVRLARRLYLRITATTVRGVEVASNLSLIPTSWSQWAKQHENATYQAAMLDWTENAIDSLFDVHGYQIFDVGLFNADCHPGNILVCSSSDEDSASSRTMDGVQIGLIDWGQCKRLDVAERARVAKLIVSVAEGATDDVIAADFRLLGVKTKNDSTKFLAEFAKLMFGKFRPEHMTHSWHKKLHQMDRVTFFPSELSMVYRTSLLLRGLAMSFQLNVSVGEKWYQHALRALRAVDKDI